MKNEEKKEPKILEDYYKSAEHENVIWVCDGAANVGQVGQAVGVLLTNLDKEGTHVLHCSRCSGL